ncbi:MAG: Tetratricopeptide repeat protein, partial [Acidobacteriota bacterium]|nr:Tetratricopeptide repeat protein [Acidobacteriota bacterium]
SAAVEALAAPAPLPAEPLAPLAPLAPLEPASSTLGDLYLAQGHLDEAEESFQSVLRSRPGDASALAGLESVRLQRGDEAAVFADDLAATEEPNVIVGGLTTRKAALLKEYLARIRRGAKRHVS